MVYGHSTKIQQAVYSMQQSYATQVNFSLAPPLHISSYAIIRCPEMLFGSGRLKPTLHKSRLFMLLSVCDILKPIALLNT